MIVIILRDQLVIRLKWYKSNPQRKILPNFKSLKFFLDGQEIENDKQIQPDCTINPNGTKFSFNIDIQNQSDQVFAETGEVWLEVNSSEFEKGDNGFKLPNNRSGSQYSGGALVKMMPQSWHMTKFTLFTNSTVRRELLVSVELKIYTELNMISIPFVIRLVNKKTQMKIL